jgi:ketosteroid isomerase-like protein
MTDINHPAVIAEVTNLYATYEAALCNNDVETMTALFWDSPDVLRFGATENLYGSQALKNFRQARGAITMQREISNLKVVALGTETAIVTLEFVGGVVGQPSHNGRQSQVWHRFDEGWRIVSAHVSWLPDEINSK